MAAYRIDRTGGPGKCLARQVDGYELQYRTNSSSNKLNFKLIKPLWF